ncbi:lysophospholipid acyltransferase family protein [Desulfatirhabdium butyrativorans]|uniref:lysophospholipid acyltransferase family protein n=1 Tax=Desulfatirhabdium butyrativorans TaxID=340467 RepID=UPI000418FBF6|nr:lysophospholipid acyltransferase family protein [Desulfatirhabdium butyrativorans]
MNFKETLYLIRTIGIVFWVIIAVIIFGTGTIIASFIDGKGIWGHIVARYWARSILFVSRTKVTVKGLENIDPGRPYIFMPNHSSNFDIPVLLSHLPVQFRWLAKAELFKFPLFGYAMKRAGYISIDRTNRRSAFESLDQAAAAIRNGKSVMIFPEGTRSRDNQIHEFKKGGFVLAIKAGVPIVPIIIHGTWQIMAKTGITIRPGNVLLEILPPIDTSAYPMNQKDRLMADLRQIMIQVFEAGKHSQ